MAYATPKQAALLVRLLIRAGKIRPSDAARAEADALLLDRRKVSDAIRKYNAELGWESRHAAATDAQHVYIRDLEMKVYGQRRTTVADRLTYDEADARIQHLRREVPRKTDTTSDVIDLFTRRALR